MYPAGAPDCGATGEGLRLVHLTSTALLEFSSANSSAMRRGSVIWISG